MTAHRLLSVLKKDFSTIRDTKLMLGSGAGAINAGGGFG